MSTSDLLDVQRYCDAATYLPQTTDDLVKQLDISASDAAQFQDMLDAYKVMSDHCQDFKMNTFKQMPLLADDVANYGLKAVSTYYPALNMVIAKWQDGTMAPDLAKAKFVAILATLKQEVVDNASKASAMQAKVAAFTDQTKKDQDVLTPIKAKYDAKYDGEGGLIAQLKTQIQGDSDQIDYWNKEYQKDVTIACTSATYAWIFPEGTIAAAVVAGVYGKKATDALDQVHHFQDDLAAATAQEQVDITLMADLHIASKSIGGILDALEGALAVLVRMEGIWNTLAGDITAIGATLDAAGGDAVIIKDLDIDAAIEQWNVVVTEAKNYSVNAFVTITTEADIKSKPATLFAVPARAA
jgi:hypothetical protein